MFNGDSNENGIKINRSNKNRKKGEFYCAANLIFLGGGGGWLHTSTTRLVAEHCVT